MTPKIVLVTIGALMTLHGIGLYFIAGTRTGYTDPTEAMIAMGARLNETIGIMTLLVGVILLASFNIETNSAKKYKPIPCRVINAPIVTKTTFGLISTPLLRFI